LFKFPTGPTRLRKSAAHFLHSFFYTTPFVTCTLMLSILNATLCSLAVGYGIVFSCSGPSCGTFDQSSFSDVSCTNDGVTSWCSNQQSCNGSLFLTEFSITIDSENDAVSVFQQVTVNGTQFTQNVSNSGQSTLPASCLTKRQKRFSKRTHFGEDSVVFLFLFLRQC
jgi:hypothetical protein